MGHLQNEIKQVYHALAHQLNRLPQSAPINDTFMEILYRVYTETEARVASKFPLLPMTLDKIAVLTSTPEEELKPILMEMSLKGLIMDVPRKDNTYYSLSPLLVGFFEMTFMRAGNNVLPVKELAELFEVYFKTDGVAEAVLGKETKTMRALVYESLISAAVETEVLSYEKASEIIRQSGGGAIAMCPCRSKATHLGKACDAPLETCTAFGTMGDWMISKGLAKPASVDEMLRVLDQTQELGLVHLVDNIMNKPAGMCHCCGCCCTLIGNKDGNGAPFAHSSNFIPKVELENCVSCGICAEKCHINAITMQDDENGTEVPVVNQDICIGCGVCASACPSGALNMSRRPVLIIPPENYKEILKRYTEQKVK